MHTHFGDTLARTIPSGATIVKGYCYGAPTRGRKPRAGTEFTKGVPLMSFAEIILRIGASIGGWLIFIGYALTLAVLREADCDPASDQIWRGTLFFGLLSGLGLLFVGRGLAWRDSIRWFSIPACALALYSGFGLLPGIDATTVGGGSLCVIANSPLTTAELAAIEASTLERIWTPLTIVVLVAGLVQGARYWWPSR